MLASQEPLNADGGNLESSNYVIPSEYNGHGVNAIGCEWNVILFFNFKWSVSKSRREFPLFCSCVLCHMF